MTPDEETEYPVLAENDGIKIKTEKMMIDKLYHCIYDSKVFLFYKDEQSLLHCYEIQDPEVVKEIVEKPTDLDTILKSHANMRTEQPQ
jgi:hypothetical protein